MLKAWGSPRWWGLHPFDDFCPSHPPPSHNCTKQSKSSVGCSWVFTPAETMGPVTSPRLQGLGRNVCWVLCWTGPLLSPLLDRLLQVPPAPAVTAQLGCERPCQPPAGRSRGFPYIQPQLSWLRNAIFKTLRLIFFFSKKYFYLHKTIKSEQLFPEKLWPSGAAAGHMRRSLFTSNSFTWQYSAGTFSFFWCKDYFSVPLVLPLLALHTDRSVFTTATWICQVPLYAAQLESVERGSGWWIKHIQPSFKCYEVAKSMFGAGETNFLLQKTIFTCSAHLQKRDEWPDGKGTSQGTAMHGAAGVSAGLFSPWGCKGLLRVWLRPASPASPVVWSQVRDRWAEAQRSWGGALARVGTGPQALDDTVLHGDSPEDWLLLGRPSTFCEKQEESR